MYIAGELQTSQNEPAAGNFATFSGIFAAYSTFRFNPLSPKSDQHQISPCNINFLYNTVVMRITDTITQDEFD